MLLSGEMEVQISNWIPMTPEEGAPYYCWTKVELPAPHYTSTDTSPGQEGQECLIIASYVVFPDTAGMGPH